MTAQWQLQESSLFKGIGANILVMRLILAGGGHGHLAVLHALARQPLRGVEVTLINPVAEQVYSGMLPGWMSGRYRLDQCLIDLRPLARKANVKLIIGSVAGMDANRRCVALSDGRHLEYDLLSLDIGSESDLSCLEAFGKGLLPIRPLNHFISEWEELLSRAKYSPGFRLAVVGGGAAGIELAFAAQHAFEKNDAPASVSLIVPERGLLPEHASGTQARVSRLLHRRGINIEIGMAAGGDGGLQMSSGAFLHCDAVIAATGARPPSWLRVSGLALDPAGFIMVGPTHASLSHSDVFAVGDVCARQDEKLQRSGVHAVRAGPILAHNLVSMLEGGQLTTYLPRRRSLYLLATRPGHALMVWGGFSASGAWAWRWKDCIDRTFIARYTEEVAD